MFYESNNMGKEKLDIFLRSFSYARIALLISPAPLLETTGDHNPS